MFLFRAVGVLYLLSGVWCIYAPELASRYVGYELSKPLGYVEFVSVYGGLQLGIALAILLTSFSRDLVKASMIYSLILSSALLACRLVSVLVWGGESALYTMLVVEALIVFILSASIKQNHRIQKPIPQPR